MVEMEVDSSASAGARRRLSQAIGWTDCVFLTKLCQEAESIGSVQVTVSRREKLHGSLWLTLPAIWECRLRAAENLEQPTQNDQDPRGNTLVLASPEQELMNRVSQEVSNKRGDG